MFVEKRKQITSGMDAHVLFAVKFVIWDMTGNGYLKAIIHGLEDAKYVEQEMNP
jgi:hypothetical protein